MDMGLWGRGGGGKERKWKGKEKGGKRKKGEEGKEGEGRRGSPEINKILYVVSTN
jgi:hypothetical protein